jgi:hypothetical protein
MNQPASDNSALRFPRVLRQVAASREALAREALPDVGRHQGQTWWELADAAGDDRVPPSAVAVTGPVDPEARVALLAATGQDRAALEQLVYALMVALRGTSAETVVVVGQVDRVTTGVLLRAGFAPGTLQGRAGDDAEGQLQVEL